MHYSDVESTEEPDGLVVLQVPQGVVAGEKFWGENCEVSSLPLPKSLLDR